MKKVFKTTGMHCKSCEMLLTDSISELKGVEKVKANYSKNEIEVEFEAPANEKEIVKAIEKEGYALAN